MSKYRIQALTFILTTFMLGCNEYMVVGVLSDIHHDFGTPFSLLGILVTVFALTYAIATPIVAIIATHFKRHHVYFCLLALFLIGNTWSALSTNFISLLLSRILTAMTAGAICSMSLIMVSFVVPLAKRAQTIAWVFAGFNIASLLGVPLGTFISTTFNWHDSFWLIDILAIFVFSLLLIYVPRNTPQVKAAEKQPSANPLQFMLNKQVILSVCFIMAICSAQFSYYTYIRPILTSEMGFSLTALNLLLLFLGLTAIIGNSLGAWGADHGGMKAIAPLYLIMAIGLILAGLTMHQLPFLSYLLLAVVCMFNSTYGATVQMLFMDIANKHYPQALDLASSLNPVFSNLGISIGSFTAAQLLPYSGPGNIVYLAAGFALVGFVLATILKRSTQI